MTRRERAVKKYMRNYLLTLKNTEASTHIIGIGYSESYRLIFRNGLLRNGIINWSKESKNVGSF